MRDYEQSTLGSFGQVFLFFFMAIFFNLKSYSQILKQFRKLLILFHELYKTYQKWNKKIRIGPETSFGNKPVEMPINSPKIEKGELLHIYHDKWPLVWPRKWLCYRPANSHVKSFCVSLRTFLAVIRKRWPFMQQVFFWLMEKSFTFWMGCAKSKQTSKESSHCPRFIFFGV